MILNGPRLPEEWEAAAMRSCACLATFASLIRSQRMDSSVIDGLPHPVLTRAACDAICARIRRDRIVPVWRPPEIETVLEPFHKWKKVCWYVPWVVLGNFMSGPMCVELQGLSIADDGAMFQLLIDIDTVEDIPGLREEAWVPDGSLVQAVTGETDPRWRRWQFTHRDGEDLIPIFEFQRDDQAGFHLEIARAILDVQWPVVERNRESSIIIHRSDDPEWRPFDSLADVVAWAFEDTEPAAGSMDGGTPYAMAQADPRALASELWIRVIIEKNVRLTVRTLLGWFGAKRRGRAVVDQLVTTLGAAGFNDVEVIREATLDEVLVFDRSGARRANG
jgi:hypothetical protein